MFTQTKVPINHELLYLSISVERIIHTDESRALLPAIAATTLFIRSDASNPGRPERDFGPLGVPRDPDHDCGALWAQVE